mmetsp:Transcript_17371/g.34585  ORF Transcript_17371/g.34585 Transcript_17371/m.34585 type:complete len:468 (-) Transcript_17371:324-1727(-)
MPMARQTHCQRLSPDRSLLPSLLILLFFTSRTLSFAPPRSIILSPRPAILLRRAPGQIAVFDRTPPTRRLSRHFLSATMSSSDSPEAAASRSKIRFATYNVLSPQLARGDYYCHTPEADLDPATRLKRVLKNMDREIREGTECNTPVLMCLQEVSQDWVGPFHIFFAERGYSLVTAPYGKNFNGYMGVALAYPTRCVVAEDVRLLTLADGDGQEGCKWPWAGEIKPERPPRPSITRRIVRYAYESLRGMVNKVPFLGAPLPPDPKKDPWNVSRSRRNVLIFGKFRMLAGGDRFCLSTYHMPCVFWDPRVMNIHASHAVGTIQALSGDLPLVFAGDFNILPGSSTYELITTGRLPPDAEEGPPSVPPPYTSPDGAEVPWSSQVARGGMPSACALAGDEPTLTNYAHTKNMDDPFVGTLDYVFCSKEHWGNVRVCTEMPASTAESGGPFPNDAEPSDHLLLSVEMDLSS